MLARCEGQNHNARIMPAHHVHITAGLDHDESTCDAAPYGGEHGNCEWADTACDSVHWDGGGGPGRWDGAAFVPVAEDASVIAYSAQVMLSPLVRQLIFTKLHFDAVKRRPATHRAVTNQ